MTVFKKKLSPLKAFIYYPKYICAHMTSAQHECRSPQKPEDYVKNPRAAVTGSCELLRGCWESNPVPLAEQPGL